MKIAVLSGKGGTGKTLVSVNLSAAAEQALYVDCDVEEPNGHLFFKPKINSVITVSQPIPNFDETKCNQCRTCVNFCAFHALAFVGNKPILFSDVCHSCGGCVDLCPEHAISEILKPIGKITKGSSEQVETLSGEMITGNASGTAIIRELYHQMEQNSNELVILDCPPGSACMVMESIKDSDYCILVAEPTIFGTHNLAMVVDLVKKFHKPFGVVLNKCTDDLNSSQLFCEENHISILEQIPFDETLGKLNSNGEIIVRTLLKYREKFVTLLEKIRKEYAQ